MNHCTGESTMNKNRILTWILHIKHKLTIALLLFVIVTIASLCKFMPCCSFTHSYLAIAIVSTLLICFALSKFMSMADAGAASLSKSWHRMKLSESSNWKQRVKQTLMSKDFSAEAADYLSGKNSETPGSSLDSKWDTSRSFHPGRQVIICKHCRNVLSPSNNSVRNSSVDKEIVQELQDSPPPPPPSSSSTEEGNVKRKISFSCSEEEFVCKTVLETHTVEGASNNTNDAVDVVSIAEDHNLPSKSSIKASLVLPSDDEDSIVKHQVLPLESCSYCNSPCSNQPDTAIDSTIRHSFYGGKRMSKCNEITDAELQNAANEFYTLEGDVLWTECDLSKQIRQKKLSSPQSNFRDKSWFSGDVLTNTVSKNSGTCCEQDNVVQTLSKNVACGDQRSPYPKVKLREYMKNEQKANCSVVSSTNEPTSMMDYEDIIDLKLKAIAFKDERNHTGSFRGRDDDMLSAATSFRDMDNNMATASSSFRDMVGSFRELDACWYNFGREVDGTTVSSGCCDDHVKPCITHSRSRSKVLQTDPLLSKASLIREQEMMDVLWQEQYNEQKCGGDDGGLMTTRSGVVYHDAGQCSSTHGNEAGNGDCSRLGIDRECWHSMAKTRSYQRRKHFIGIYRVLRELGLKQCLQSSKVDN